MKTGILITFLLLVAGFLSSHDALAVGRLPKSAMEKVDVAFKKGEISRDEAALYKTFSIFDRDRLPERFKRTEGVTPVKNGTMIIRQLKKDFDTLSLQTQETLRPYLFKKKGRPSGKLLAKTAGTGSSISNKNVLDGEHYLFNFTTTTNFNIEWGNDYSVDPADVARWAEYLENSWFEIISSQGYAVPKGADTNLIDVYIGNTDNTQTIDDINSNWYGYTDVYAVPAGVPYMVVNREYGWAPFNEDIDPIAGAMKVTAAHEFFHTVHFTIDYLEDSWWMEASSTWMEDRVYNGVNDYYNYIGPGSDWVNYPNVSLILFNWSHEYGDVLWGKYLSENWGGELAIKAIWDNCVIVPDSSSVSAMSTFFSDRGSTLADAFRDFAIKNVFMNYSEGSSYGSMAIRSVYSTYTSDVQDLSGSKSPDYLGSNYLRFDPAGGSYLTIAFDGDEYYRGRNITWGASIVMPTLTGYTSFEISLDSNVQNGFATISGYSNYSAVYLVANVLSPTGLTPAESSHTDYYAYPDGIPYAIHAYENFSTPSLPLMEYPDNDAVIEIGKLNGGGGGGGGGGCFIATAAYGYYDEPHVMLLRNFRDRFLLTNSPGRSFVEFYYRVSPDMADYIADREWLKSIVRVMLMPLIAFAWLALKVPGALYFFTFILLGAVILKLYSLKKRLIQPIL